MQGSQATYSQASAPAHGKVVPPAGKNQPTPAASHAGAAAFAAQLNRHLNDSGRPDEFRLDNSGKLIQQVNPTTGAVIGEFSVSEFPALARSVGASGVFVDDRA